MSLIVYPIGKVHNGETQPWQKTDHEDSCLEPLVQQ
jgi:hypothetical protein